MLGFLHVKDELFLHALHLLPEDLLVASPQLLLNGRLKLLLVAIMNGLLGQQFLAKHHVIAPKADHLEEGRQVPVQCNHPPESLRFYQNQEDDGLVLVGEGQQAQTKLSTLPK